MIRTLRGLISGFAGNSDAAAAVEAAIFAPIFLILTLGVTDLGSGMFVEMQVNAATQAGAFYAVMHYSGSCASLSAACLSGIETAMNDAAGNPSFCTGTVCQASFTACSEANGGVCFTVSASYPFSPILPVTSGLFSRSWTRTQTYSSTATVRVPST
jgi:Flp pilus assembly protein TadG